MNFAFSEEQRQLADAVRSVLDVESSPDRVRETVNGGTGVDRERWRVLADLGLTSVLLSKGLNGFGGTQLDIVLLLEACGRVCLPEPVLETVAVATPLLAALDPMTPGRDQLLKQIGEGSMLVTVADASDSLVASASAADKMLIADGEALRLVELDRATIIPEPSIDEGRRLARVTFDPEVSAVLAHGAEVESLRGYMRRHASFGAACILIGLAAQVTHMAAEHARQREQFGRPIGAFQAVKHLVADCLVSLDFARPVVYRAAHSIATDAPTMDRDVSMAKALAADAATKAAGAALQVHGAIGYTSEHDLHMWFKRIRSLNASWGSPEHHRRMVGHALTGA